jgi:hypothetical protein
MMIKRIFAFLLATLSLFLVSCGRTGEPTEFGFIDGKTGIEYVDVKPMGLYAVTAGEEYLKVKLGESEQTYFQVEFEDPKKFLCFEDSGENLLVRAKDVEEPTLSTFDPIAALVYNETNTVFITNLFADAEYLPEGEKYNNPTEDSDLCRMIADQLVNGEAVTVKDSDILKNDMFFIRLLSQKYPGLYYLVVFYGATDGRYYLLDRANGKTVYCPNDIIVRMVGE